VIFDLDGTLADTSGDLIAAGNAAMVAMGYAPQLERGRDDPIALRGGRAMLTLGLTRLGRFDEAVVDAYYPRLLAAYGEAIDIFTRMYPGAMDAVEALRGAGYGVGICTNKPEALAEKLLTRLGVRAAFASLVGADTLPNRKPAPEPYVEAVRRAGGAVERSLLVGDTDTDRKTARAAGVPCVLVTFGPAGPEMAALEPQALIGHYDELPAVVERLLARGGQTARPRV
jgi:phosphoglycolate phosphatase